MKDHNILTNIWMNRAGNKLYCADIYFDQKILDIIPRDGKTYHWEELQDPGIKNRLYPSKSKKNFNEAAQIFDGNFLLLMPGAIDSHVHFNSPGYEDREDFEHGSLSALFGGVTTVVDMPCTSVPPVTNAENFNTKLSNIKKRSYVDFALWGGVRGNDFKLGEKRVQKQIKELAQCGVAGFKVYLISGMDSFTDLTFEQIYQTAEWVKATGLPMAVHAEKKQYILDKKNIFLQKNNHSWEAYCEARNFIAEGEAVAEMMNISRITKCPVHIVHLSSQFGISIIEKAQASGIPITAETCPHYLYFTMKDFENSQIRAYLKTAPPVKQLHDKEALWLGLKKGTLRFVTTDHAGCNPEIEKSSTNFWEIYGGIPGVEHRVPFLLSEGFLNNRLSLEETIRFLSGNVAEYFGFSKKGMLRPGRDADMVLVNLWKGANVTAQDMHCKGKYTPFENVYFRAKTESVFLKGKPAILNGILKTKEPGKGRFVPAKS